MAALMLAGSTSVGLAAEPPCFELYQNANASGPEGTILINKCTGETWLLVGVDTGSGPSFSWHAVPVDMSADAAQTVPDPEDGSKTESDAAYAD